MPSAALATESGGLRVQRAGASVRRRSERAPHAARSGHAALLCGQAKRQRAAASAAPSCVSIGPGATRQLLLRGSVQLSKVGGSGASLHGPRLDAANLPDSTRSLRRGTSPACPKARRRPGAAACSTRLFACCRPATNDALSPHLRCHRGHRDAATVGSDARADRKQHQVRAQQHAAEPGRALGLGLLLPIRTRRQALSSLPGLRPASASAMSPAALGVTSGRHGSPHSARLTPARQPQRRRATRQHAACRASA